MNEVNETIKMINRCAERQQASIVVVDEKTVTFVYYPEEKYDGPMPYINVPLGGATYLKLLMLGFKEC